MMRLSIFVGAILLAAGVGHAALAQSTNWTEPGGRFSLSFAGWTAVPTERAAQAGDMLIILRNDSLTDKRPRVCAVSQRPPHPDLGQAAANDALDSVSAAVIEKNVGQPVTGLSHGRVSGVATLDYGVTLNGAQQHTRDFVLAGDGQMLVFDISCGAPPPMTADEAASISAVLDSLTILPRPAH